MILIGSFILSPILLGAYIEQPSSKFIYDNTTKILSYINNKSKISLIKTDDPFCKILKDDPREIWFLAASPIVDAENYDLYKLTKNPITIRIYNLPSCDFMGVSLDLLIFMPDLEFRGEYFILFSTQSKLLKKCKLEYDLAETPIVQGRKIIYKNKMKQYSIDIEQLWLKGTEIE